MERRREHIWSGAQNSTVENEPIGHIKVRNPIFAEERTADASVESGVMAGEHSPKCGLMGVARTFTYCLHIVSVKRVGRH